MASPPGNSSGPWARSPLLTLTTCSGLPPFSETRRIPLLPWPNNIQPWLHVIPQTLSAGQRVPAAPPVTAIFLIVESGPLQKAIERPSGENTGFVTPTFVDSAPRIGRASNSDINLR